MKIEEAKEIFLANEEMQQILMIIEEMNLNEACLVAGSIYRNLWNVMTEQSFKILTDVDVAFFDKEISYEDSRQFSIKANEKYPQYNWEIFNQAYGHLQNGGGVFEPFENVEQGIANFPEIFSSIAVRKNGDKYEWLEPYGTYDLENFIIQPTSKWLENEKFYEKFLWRKESKRLDECYPVTYILKE